MPGADRIQIFRTGRHTAMSGATLDFSEDVLAKMADAYDPDRHEAPIVVGHPRTNAPAYGWVKQLQFAEPFLEAETHQVDPDFAEAVRAGRYKKISASFYNPDSPANPVPGVYYLRHVGFLGAQPPAVKGLRDASFADDEQGVTVVEFGEISPFTISGFLRRLREWLIERHSRDDADQVVPEYLVAEAEDAARREDDARMGAATPDQFSEPDAAGRAKSKTSEDPAMPDNHDDLKQKQEEIARKEAEFAEREARLQAQERRMKQAAVADFVEGLVKDGRILPREQAPLVEFMTALDDQAELEFSEDGKTVKKASAEWLREFLEALPRRVEFGESTPGSADEQVSVDFSAPPGYSVDPQSLELYRKATAYQKQHPDVEFAEAVRAVSAA